MLREFFLGNSQEKEKLDSAKKLQTKRSLNHTQRGMVSEAEQISRRLFLRRMGAGGASVVLAPTALWCLFRPGIFSGNQNTGVEYSSSGSPFPEVTTYYPEIAELQPQERGSLRTPGGRLVTWINASGLKIDNSALGKLYGAVEQVASLALQGSFDNHPRAGIGSSIHFHTSYFGGRENIIFFVSTGAPVGNTWSNFEEEGVTLLNYGSNVDLIRISKVNPKLVTPDAKEMFGDDIGHMNSALATEMGQSLINAHSAYSDELVFNNDMVIKEWFNNSLSTLINFKFRRKNYRQYTSLVRNATTEIRSIGRIGLMVFPEVVWNSIPNLNPPIKA